MSEAQKYYQKDNLFNYFPTLAPSYTTKASIPDLIEIQFNWLNTDQNSIYRELYIGNLFWQIPFVICELSHLSKSTIMANGLKIEW